MQRYVQIPNRCDDVHLASAHRRKRHRDKRDDQAQHIPDRRRARRNTRTDAQVGCINEQIQNNAGEQECGQYTESDTYGSRDHCVRQTFGDELADEVTALLTNGAADAQF